MDHLLLLLLALLLVAGFTQGATGFGFGLVVMSVLPHVLDVREAVPLVSVYGLVLTIVMLWRYRAWISPRRFLPVLAGVAVGTPLGALYLRSIDPRVVTGTLGAFLLVYATTSLLAERGRGDAAPEVRIGRRWGPVAGLLGGLLGGAFNTGGPPIIVYATARGWDAGDVQGQPAGAVPLQHRDAARALRLVGSPHAGDPATGPDRHARAARGPVRRHVGVVAARRVRFRRVVLALLVVFGVVFLSGPCSSGPYGPVGSSGSSGGSSSGSTGGTGAGGRPAPPHPRSPRTPS